MGTMAPCVMTVSTIFPNRMGIATLLPAPAVSKAKAAAACGRAPGTSESWRPTSLRTWGPEAVGNRIITPPPLLPTPAKW